MAVAFLPDKVSSWLQDVIIIGAGIGAAATAWRYVVRPVSKAGRILAEVVKLSEIVARQEERLAALEARTDELPQLLRAMHERIFSIDEQKGLPHGHED